MKWDGRIALPLLAVLLIMILFPLIFEKQAPTGEFEFLMGLKVPENVQTQVAPEDVDLNEKEFKDIIDQDILQRRKEIGPFSFSPLPNDEPNMYAYTNHELKARVKMDDEGGWYLGEWNRDEINGKGIRYVGGREPSLYEGFFLDSKMCGPGRIIHKDGVVIEGLFNKEEKLEGEFTKSFKDGSYYQRSRDEQGNFVDKFFTHEGVEQSCDQETTDDQNAETDQKVSTVKKEPKDLEFVKSFSHLIDIPVVLYFPATESLLLNRGKDKKSVYGRNLEDTAAHWKICRTPDDRSRYFILSLKVETDNSKEGAQSFYKNLHNLSFKHKQEIGDISKFWGQTTKHKLDDNSKFKISVHTKDVGNKDCLLFTSAWNDEDKVHTNEDKNCLLDKDEKGEHLNSLILVVPLEELGWDLKNEKFKDNAPPDFSKVKDKYPGSSEARPSTPEEQDQLLIRT